MLRAKNILTVSIGEGIAKGLNISLILILPLLVSLDSLAVISLVIGFEQVVLSMFVFGQNTVLLRFYSTFEQYSNQYFNSLITNVLFITSVVSIPIIAFIFIYSKYTETSLQVHFLIILVATVFIALNEIYLVYLRAASKFDRYVFVRLSFQVLKMATILLFVMLNFDSLSYSLGIIVTSVLVITLLNTEIRNYSFDKNKIRLSKLLITFAVPLSLHSLAGIAYSVIDRFMISFLLDMDSVGIYAFSYTIGSSVFFVINIVVLLLLPTVFKHKKYTVEAETELRNFIQKILLIVLIVSAALNLLIYPVVIGLYNSDYLIGKTVVALVSCSFIFHTLYLYGFYKLTLLKKIKLVPIFSVGALATNFTLNLYLIPRYGINGAGLSTLLSEFFLGLCIVLYANHRAKLIRC